MTIPRSATRLLACLALCLPAVCASPGSAAIATGTGVHSWLFDGSRTVVDTVSEARTVARRNDIVVGVSRYGRYLGAMKRAKPGILIAEYHKGSTVKADFAWVQANHPDWLLRDSAATCSRVMGRLPDQPAAGRRASWEAQSPRPNRPRDGRP